MGSNSPQHSNRFQKDSFKANCISRGSPGPPEPVPRIGLSVFVLLPNAPVKPVNGRKLFGFWKFGWLKALKNSVLNCNFTLSDTSNILNRLRSVTWIPGPWNMRGRQEPNVPGAGTAKAAGLMKNPVVVNLE